MGTVGMPVVVKARMLYSGLNQLDTLSSRHSQRERAIDDDESRVDEAIHRSNEESILPSCLYRPSLLRSCVSLWTTVHDIVDMEAFSDRADSYGMLAELLRSAPSFKRPPSRPKSSSIRVSPCMPVTILHTEDGLRRPDPTSIKRSSPLSQNVWSTTVTLTPLRH